MQRVAPADGSDSFVLDVAGSFSAKSTDKMNKLHQITANISRQLV